MHATVPMDVSWHPAKKLLFRFFFIYCFIYCFPFPFDSFEFTKPLALPVYSFLDYVIPRIGKNWFDIHASVAFPMFDKVDDSGYGLVFLYTNLIISIAGAFIWSIADRKRKNYEKLYQWLKIYLRFWLAAYLFGYGFVKIFPSQFQAITASRLTLLVGEQSPMLLAWNFMGHSTIFMRFMGFAEVAAGLLLLFRRTTTLGAILSCGVFSFIVLLDFCFNVPIRLLSSHLLLISFFLTLEDRQKLVNVLLLNKPTATSIQTPLIANPLWRKVFLGIQLLVVIGILTTSIANSIITNKKIGQNAPRVPLYGVYNTAYFIRNNDTVPPLGSDSSYWKQLVIDGGSWNQSGIIHYISGRKTFFNIDADTVKQTLQIQSRSDTAEKYLFKYTDHHSGYFVLEGIWKQDSLKVFMSKYDLNNFLLHKEKFKWIED